MGKYVNVVLPGGKVVAVTEEEAAQLGDVSRRQTDQEAAQGAVASRNEAAFSGPGAKAGTFLEGLLDTASGGLYGKAVSTLGSDSQAEGMRARAQINPGTRFAADAIGTLAPTGLLGKGAKLATGNTFGGLADDLGRQLGGKTGRVTEGALQGLGGHIARTNVTGDPLTIEGAISSAGLGSFLNLSFGLVGDKLIGASKKAQAKVAEAAEHTKDITSIKAVPETLKAFEDSPAYKDAQAAFIAHQKTQKAAYEAFAEATEAYQSLAKNDSKLTIAVTRAEDVIKGVEKKYAPRAVRVGEGVTGDDAVTIGGKAPKTAADVVDGQESILSARRLKSRGWEEPPGTGADAVKMDKARAAIKEGQRDPVTINVTPTGKLVVENGRHRLAAAVEQGKDIRVKWQRGVDPEMPPMSDEMLKRHDDWQARISQIYKKKGGGWRIDAGRWVPDRAVKPDVKGAIEDLRGVYSEMRQIYPKRAGSKLKDTLPDLPVDLSSTPMKFEPVALPKTLREFARMKETSIAKLAGQMDDTSKEMFGRLADDIGLARAGTPEETIAALHKHLKATTTTLDKVAMTAATKQAESSASVIGWLKNFTRGAAGLAFGRVANKSLGGGWLGAVGQVGASNAARSGMGALDDALLDNALLASKDGIRGRVRSIVGTYGAKAGENVGKLGPVTAYLSQRLTTGEPDSEKDPGKQVVNRITEIINATQTAPDSIYMAVEGMLGHPGDVGWKMHNHIVNALNYLTMKLPKDPGLDISMFKSNWEPSSDEAIEMAHHIEAVFSPTDAIERLLSGDGHPETAETLWAVWPGTMNEFAGEVMAIADQFEDVPLETASIYSEIFRVPLTAFDDPDVAALLQGQYLPKPEQMASASPSSPSPGGRPPAVQSKVAGSSVSALIA